MQDDEITAAADAEKNMAVNDELLNLQQDYDRLKEQFEELSRKNILEKISSECGCTDPEYFEFCAAKKKIDTADADALRRFAAELSAASPGCFKAKIIPGSSGTAADPARISSRREVFHGDRIGEIALSVSNAPDV